MNKRIKGIFSNSICISIVIFLLCRFILPNGGVSTEDFIMGNILTGEYGEASSQITFSNIFLGAILKRLYYFIPQIDWWYKIQVIFIVVSIIILVHTIITKLKDDMGVLCGSVAALALGVFSLYAIDYKKTSVVLCIVGFILLLINRKRAGFFGNIVGGGLVLIGSLYCIESIYMATIFSLGIIIDSIIKEKKRNFKQVLRYKYIFFFIAISLLMYIGSEFICNRDETWRTWREVYESYQELRTEGIPQWSEHQEEYNDIGLSENDVKNLNLGIIDDSTIFNTEVLEQVSNIDKKSNDHYTILQLLIYTLFRDVIGITALLLLIIQLWFGKDNSFVLWYTCVGYITIFGYINFQHGSIFVEKAGFLVYTGILINLIYLLITSKKETIKMPLGQMIAIITVVLAFTIGHVREKYSLSYSSKDRTEFKETIHMIQEDRGNLYILDGNYFQNLVLSCETRYQDNIILTGEDIFPVPTLQKKFEQYGGRNITELFLSDANVYLVTKDMQTIENILFYLEYHYGRNMETIVTQEANFYKVQFKNVF